PDAPRLSDADRHPPVLERPRRVVPLVLEQQAVHAGPAVQRGTLEQGRVPLGMGHDLGGRRQHDVPVAPDTGGGATDRRAPALGEPPEQLLPSRSGKPVLDLQQTPAADAAGMWVGLRHLVSAGHADLPGLRPFDADSHAITRAPVRSTSAILTVAERPASEYASRIAVPA